MDKKRMEEISLMLLKYRAKKDGIFLNSIRREIGNVSKELGISIDELKQFTKQIFHEVTDEALA